MKKAGNLPFRVADQYKVAMSSGRYLFFHGGLLHSQSEIAGILKNSDPRAFILIAGQFESERLKKENVVPLLGFTREIYEQYNIPCSESNMQTRSTGRWCELTRSSFDSYSQVTDFKGLQQRVLRRGREVAQKLPAMYPNRDEWRDYQVATYWEEHFGNDDIKANQDEMIKVLTSFECATPPVVPSGSASTDSMDVDQANSDVDQANFFAELVGCSQSTNHFELSQSQSQRQNQLDDDIGDVDMFPTIDEPCGAHVCIHKKFFWVYFFVGVYKIFFLVIFLWPTNIET